jgi:hypothetical protein
MKKHLPLRLSFWANQHRLAAICSHVVLRILLSILAFGTGIWAALEGLVLPDATKWLLTVLFVVGIVAYPARHLKRRLGVVAFFRRQKIMDGALAVLSAALLFFAGNLSPAWVALPAAPLTSVYISDQTLPPISVETLPPVSVETLPPVSVETLPLLSKHVKVKKPALLCRKNDKATWQTQPRTCNRYGTFCNCGPKGSAYGRFGMRRA